MINEHPGAEVDRLLALGEWLDERGISWEEWQSLKPRKKDDEPPTYQLTRWLEKRGISFEEWSAHLEAADSLSE